MAQHGQGEAAQRELRGVKIIESAQRRWRMVNAAALVALIRAGATFISGKLVERPGEPSLPEALALPA